MCHFCCLFLAVLAEAKLVKGKHCSLTLSTKRGSRTLHTSGALGAVRSLPLVEFLYSMFPVRHSSSFLFFKCYFYPTSHTTSRSPFFKEKKASHRALIILKPLFLSYDWLQICVSQHVIVSSWGPKLARPVVVIFVSSFRVPSCANGISLGLKCSFRLTAGCGYTVEGGSGDISALIVLHDVAGLFSPLHVIFFSCQRYQRASRGLL